MRICAFLFLLAWIPAVYYIALRFTSALAAGLVTLVAVAWSFPNYPAAMPSWHNLFFVTFGAAALLRYLEVRRARWLFVAGLCGGVSILIKVIGAFYIAGVLLFLAFLEQGDEQNDEQTDHESAETGKSAIPYRVFSTSALLLFLATVGYVFHARLGLGELYHFVLPAAVLVALILLGERNAREAAAGERFSGLLKLVIPFVCGVLSPVIAFLVPYARSGAVGQCFSRATSSAIARSADVLAALVDSCRAGLYWRCQIWATEASASFDDGFVRLSGTLALPASHTDLINLTVLSVSAAGSDHS